MTPPLIVSMLNSTGPFYVDPSRWFLYLVNPPAKDTSVLNLSSVALDSVHTQIQWTYIGGIGGSFTVGVIHTDACAPAFLPVTVQDGPDHILVTLTISIVVFCAGVVLHVLSPRLWRRWGVGGRVPGAPSWDDFTAVFSFDLDPVRSRAGPGGAIYLHFVRSMLWIGAMFTPFWIVSALNFVYGTEQFQSGVGLFMTDNANSSSEPWLHYLNEIASGLGMLALWCFGAVMTVRQSRALFDKKPPASVTDITLHFQRLPKAITANELRQRLTQALGSRRPILALHLIRNPNTQKSTGHAFVSFDRVISVSKLRQALLTDSTHRYSGQVLRGSYTMLAEDSIAGWQQFPPLPKQVLITHGTHPENIIWPNFLLPPPERRSYVCAQKWFSLTAHFLGMAVTFGALLAQNLLNTPSVILMLDASISRVSSVLGVGVTLFLSVFRMLLALLAWRMCVKAHEINRASTERRYMFMERSITFGSLLTGSTLWASVGSPLLALFAGLDVSSKFTAEFVMAVLIQMMMFEPGMRLIDMKHWVQVLLALIRRSKMMPRREPTDSEFSFANRYAITTILPLVSISGNNVTVAGMLLFPVTLGLYFFDRYQLLFVHRKPTNIELHREMAYFGMKALIGYPTIIAALSLVTILAQVALLGSSLPVVSFAFNAIIVLATIIFVPCFRRNRRMRAARMRPSDLQLRLLDWTEVEQRAILTAYAPPSWFLKTDADRMQDNELPDRSLFEGPDFM
eukprot:TRINITY_DN11465_c0_g1_i1.p1 TRINITY_DN11465_c0_g1~~TRINITY_DN11465_c0_g1_i1.p1  ORF type:complete len:738 (+),score=114.21 TRINITY_DN11465_c0_g1_i1:331-2544(+)